MMHKEKKSLFERLLGTVRIPDDAESNLPIHKERESAQNGFKLPVHAEHELHVEDEEGQLSLDMYETDKEIILEAMIAGVRPDDIQLSITRDQVTIRGKRESNTHIQEDGYFLKELYWGAFSRTVALPHEIVIEEADAVEKHGLLIIRLPKLDKNRQSKLRVKSI